MINAGLIGCGRMGVFTPEKVRSALPEFWFPLSHFDALCETDDIKLIAISDSNYERLQNTSKRFPSANAYKDFSELLANEPIDLLCVATRTQERPSIIEAAIDSGVKALHVEKPLCNSVADLDKLTNLLKRNNIYLTYGAIRRYLPPYKKALELIASRVYGDIVEIQVNMGAGQLFWTHPHSVDLILYFAGSRKIKSLRCDFDNIEIQSRNVIYNDPVIESAEILFEDGLRARITKQPGFDLVVTCERGQITVGADGLYLTEKLFDNNGYYVSANILSESCVVGGTSFAIKDLVNKLDSNANPENCHILNGQKILFGFAYSAISGGIHVDLEELPNDLVLLAYTSGLYA